MDYDPITGEITRKSTGKRTGSINSRGYIVVNLKGRSYQAHRLAVALMTGKWPKRGQVVDHRNHNRSDNSWLNLRELSQAENLLNRQLGSNNKSGARGVCLSKATGKWEAGLKRFRLKYHLGLFDTVEEASEAYQSASSMFDQLRNMAKIHRDGFDLVTSWESLRRAKGFA